MCAPAPVSAGCAPSRTRTLGVPPLWQQLESSLRAACEEFVVHATSELVEPLLSLLAAASAFVDQRSAMGRAEEEEEGGGGGGESADEALAVFVTKEEGCAGKRWRSSPRRAADARADAARDLAQTQPPLLRAWLTRRSE